MPGSGFDALVRGAQCDEDLAPVSTPAGNSFVSELAVRGADAGKILIQRLILGGDLVGIGLGIKLPPQPRALGRRSLPHRIDPGVLAEVAQQVQHLIEVGNHPGLRERDQGRVGALGGPLADHELQLAQRDAVRRQPDNLALDRAAAAEPQRVVVDDFLLLVQHVKRDRCRTGEIISFDVSEERVGAIAHGTAGVEDHGKRIGSTAPAGSLVGENRGGGGPLGE